MRHLRHQHGPDRALTDATTARFGKDVEGKTEKAGLRTVAVDSRRTSPACSGCVVAHAPSLDPRTFRCMSCGPSMDRDRNAVVNVRRRVVALSASMDRKLAARRERRSCASDPGSVAPALGRDGAKSRLQDTEASN